MKKRITISIAGLLAAALLALITPVNPVEAQQGALRQIADTGVIKLGPNQVLRVSVVSVDGELGGGLYGAVRFRQIGYSQGACTGGVCKHTIVSQTTSAPVLLAQGEAAASDGADLLTWQRMVVLGNRKDLKVTAIVFDTSTQRIVSFVSTTFDDQA